MADDKFDLSAGYTTPPQGIDLSAGYTTPSNPSNPEAIDLSAGYAKAPATQSTQSTQSPSPQSQDGLVDYLSKGITSKEGDQFEHRSNPAHNPIISMYFNPTMQKILGNWLGVVKQGSDIAATSALGVQPTTPITPESSRSTEEKVKVGAAKGAFGMGASMIADPRNLPFLAAPAAEAYPILGKLISAGFASQMGGQSISQIGDLYYNWDNLTPEQRAESLTSAIGTSGMAALAFKHSASSPKEGTIAHSLTEPEKDYLQEVIAKAPPDQVGDLTQAMDSHLGSRLVDFEREGEKIGHAYLAGRDDIGPGVAEVAYSELSPEYRGRGLGIELYKHLADKAAEGGFTRLISDSIRSPEAERLWQSLVNKGYAKPIEITSTDPDGITRPQQRFELDMQKALGEDKYNELIKSQLSKVPSNAPESEGLPDRGPLSAPVNKGEETPPPQEGRIETLQHDTGTPRGEGEPSTGPLPSPQPEGDRGEASQGTQGTQGIGEGIRELQSLLPEFERSIGGVEEAAPPATSPATREGPDTGVSGAQEQPPISKPVISEAIDDDLLKKGIQVVEKGKDMWLTGRLLGSLQESARLLSEQGHPLGPLLSNISGTISNVTKAIARNTMRIMDTYTKGAKALVSREEWSNQVVKLMDDPNVTPGTRPEGIPDNIWKAYTTSRAIDESIRQGIIKAKRQELTLRGVSPTQAAEWIPDDWGMVNGHYHHSFPGTWTITRLADIDHETGEMTYEPIDTGWRAESKAEAQSRALDYLRSHPDEELKLEQETVTLPGKSLSDRSALIDISKQVKDASQIIAKGGDAEEILRSLYDESAAVAYGPRRPARRQFGAALARESNLPGWAKDRDNFERYLIASQRYIELAPARQALLKARNSIAEISGMPSIQRIGEMPSSTGYFNASQYGNILARVDSAIEGLEGHPGAWDAMTRYVLNQMGWDPNLISAISRPLQSVTALLKLGFNPARVLSHGLQTLWGVYPVLGERWTLNGLAHSYDPNYKFLTDDLALRHGMNATELEGLHSYVGAYFGKGSNVIDWAKGSAGILKDIGMLPFTTGIELTRRVAAIGAYNKGISEGMDQTAARNYARDIMDRTSGNYSAADNSTLLRQLPGPVAQFKNFMLKTSQFMWGLRGWELPRFFAAVGALGFAGFPFLRSFSNLIKNTTGEDIENDLKRAFPRASRGVFGALGTDIPSGVGLGDLSISRDNSPLSGLGGPVATDAIALTTALAEQSKGPSRKASEDLDTAIRNLSPEARRIWDEATRMATKPSVVDPRTGSNIIKSLSPVERAELLTGFTPLRVAQERETHEYIRNQVEEAKDKRGYFVDRLAETQLQLSRHDLTEGQKMDIVKGIVALQKQANEYGVGANLAKAVRERAREMQMERLQRDLKHAPKSERRDIYNEIQRYKQE